MITDDSYFSIKYVFKFPDGNVKPFELKLSTENFNIVRDTDPMLSKWAQMEYFKCPNCPLSSTEKFCPLALHLIDFLKFFKDFWSYQEITLDIITPEREYHKKTSLQDGARGLLGIIMPASGCPILGKLKPMTRFHLPFSTIEETQFRVLGMYLISQYLMQQKGQIPDWDIKNLKGIYEKIIIVNRNVSEKIRQLSLKDASINALIILDVLANQVLFAIEEKDLEFFYKLFSDYC